jgi:hypothetical protein
MEHLVRMALKETKVTLANKVLLVLRVFLANKVSRDPKVRRAKKVTLVNPELLVRTVRTVCLRP